MGGDFLGELRRVVGLGLERLASQFRFDTTQGEALALVVGIDGFAVGFADQRIHAHQYLAGEDALPFLDQDVLDDTRFGRLDNLDVAFWNQLALGYGDDVKVADQRPEE